MLRANITKNKDLRNYYVKKLTDALHFKIKNALFIDKLKKIVYKTSIRKKVIYV